MMALNARHICHRIHGWPLASASRTASSQLSSLQWRRAAFLSSASPRSPGGDVQRRQRTKLDFLALDKKWRDRWTAAGVGIVPDEPDASTNSTTDSARDSRDKSKYILSMFPYPSGNLHLGHLRVYTIADVVARFHRLQGTRVLLPMGFDSFGLPAENAANQRGIQPATWTRDNIAHMKEQLALMNGSFDWTRELSTCEPEFYKHTQRIFLLLHEMGLAYQAEAEVNYDPVDQTVLANEQVDAQGRSWRSGALVEKKNLRQWFLRISALRESLLADLDVLARNDAWPERVLSMQRQWLGRSTGALVRFPLLASTDRTPLQHENGDLVLHIRVFTTRIDTLFGVQYIALAANHPIVQDLARHDPELRAFLDTLPGLPPDSKVGYLLPQLRAINPLAYHDATPAAAKASLPIYVAPYVLGDYGEGAVMGVPGHDVRDHAFWKHHHANEPVRLVIAATDDSMTAVRLEDDSANDGPFVDHGIMNEHGGPFCGRTSQEAATMLLSMLQEAHLAEPTERWRLRDWLVSRQRYWGAPIPMIHCDTCGPVPVPEADLPVTLPNVDRHFAEQRAGNPLASASDWINVPCPQCHQPARRDTDTMDTFVDSSWYYLRFADPHNKDAPFSPAKGAAWLPVDIYIGGIEHAILHLLYARFVYKAIMSSPLSGKSKEGGDGAENEEDVSEPFRRLITQGMVHGKTFIEPSSGRFLQPNEVDLGNPDEPRDAATGSPLTVRYEKMSKSKYNGIDPTDFILAHGADATRAHVLFQAPVSEILSWDDEKVAGITRWLERLHDLVKVTAAEKTDKLTSLSVTTDLRQRAASIASTSDAKELARWDADSGVWRQVQSTIASVTASYERVYSLNTVVSDLMSLTNSLATHQDLASPSVLRQAVSDLVRMLAPIAPAVAEESWALLHPEAGMLFSGQATPNFPVVDGSLAWLQPRMQNCVVQVGGRVRCAVNIPRPPAGLAGDELQDWLIGALLQSDEVRSKLARSEEEVRQAKKIIVVQGGKLVNFLF